MRNKLLVVAFVVTTTLLTGFILVCLKIRRHP
jgi:hypothetical protein